MIEVYGIVCQIPAVLHPNMTVKWVLGWGQVNQVQINQGADLQRILCQTYDSAGLVPD